MNSVPTIVFQTASQGHGRRLGTKDSQYIASLVHLGVTHNLSMSKKVLRRRRDELEVAWRNKRRERACCRILNAVFRYRMLPFCGCTVDRTKVD